MRDNRQNEDDGRVIADMSDVSRTPLLMPRFDEFRKGSGTGNHDNSGGQNASAQQPVYLDREERFAMIKGALAAVFLVGGTLFLAFAALILFILKVWG